MIILGIDQGIASCGYAIVKKEGDNYERIKSGVIKTTTNKTMGGRLQYIMDFIGELIEEHSPEQICCEKLFFNPSSGGRNKSAGMMYTNMSTTLLHLLSNEFNIEMESFVPGTVKKQVTGNGRATKETVIDAIDLLFKHNCKTEHEADALSIAVTGIRKRNELQEKAQKKTIREAKNKDKLK